ncbi:MAG: hypothetical protein JWM86_1112 [Thermoleophilia bacterium]|nr:hypothetical protein [Thermoleophilia bacterium]
MPTRPPRSIRHPLLAALVTWCALAACTVAPGAAGAAIEAGAVGPNVLVRPGDATAGAGAIALRAAGNEVESVQLVVRGGGSPLTGVDVSVEGVLAGPGGVTIDPSHLRVYRVGYYNVTGFPSDGDLGGALGAFPDSLVPRVDAIWGEPRRAFPIDVPAGQNRLAWLDVHVPAGSPAGDYAGASLVVRAAGQAQRSVTIAVHVVDVDLPSTTSLDGGFDVNPNRICQAHDCAAYPGGAAALTAAYARIALDDRLTLAKPPNATPSGPSDSSYRTYTRPLIVGSDQTQLAGARLRTITIYQWATESADEWRRTAEADSFTDRVRFHCDEIATSSTAWSNCRRDWSRANELWRGAATGTGVTDLPLQVTTSLDDVAWARANGFGDFADRIAVLIPVINRVHPKSRPAFPGRRAEFAPWASGTTPGGAPRSLWSYTSCMSMGCSPASGDPETEWRGWASYGIDQPAMQARAMGWISWTYDLAGEYYYETARDLPTAWSDQWSDDGGNHGDGTLFYPGTVAQVGGTHDVPIESIRLKRIRDGREDYEWLRIAASTTGRAAVQDVARTAFDTAFATDVPQARVDAARLALEPWVSGAATRTIRDGGDGGATDGTRSGPTGTIPGGTAPRRPTCGGRRATLVGTQRADVLRGTRGVDVIVGLGGNDRIAGLGRGDIMCAGPGNDLITTSGDGLARDLVSCGTGRDRVVQDRRDRILPGCERRTRTR